MAGQWTDKNEIMRDLSVAQGRTVPVEIDATVAGQKPPPRYVVEQTEEEYFREWVGSDDADINTGPDLELIKQMLDMVNAYDDHSCLVKDDVSKNNETQTYKSSNEGNSLQVKKEIKNKSNKPQRNIAMASLLQKFPDNDIQMSTNVPIKLLKPNDFILTNKEEITITKEKVNCGLEKEEKSLMVLQNPASMFKRKNVFTEVNRSEKVSVEPVLDNCNRKFVPSKVAEEHYNMYLERSKANQVLHEDIWTKIQRQMKDIDKNRKTKVAQEDDHNTKVSGLDKVRLPQYRHLLPEECVVCKVLCITKEK